MCHPTSFTMTLRLHFVYTWPTLNLAHCGSWGSRVSAKGGPWRHSETNEVLQMKTLRDNVTTTGTDRHVVWDGVTCRKRKMLKVPKRTSERFFPMSKTLGSFPTPFIGGFGAIPFPKESECHWHVQFQLQVLAVRRCSSRKGQCGWDEQDESEKGNSDVWSWEVWS